VLPPRGRVGDVVLVAPGELDLLKATSYPGVMARFMRDRLADGVGGG